MRKKLLILFSIIFISKITISLFINGLILYPDESCIFLKAKFFIDNFAIATCSEISTTPVGDPMLMDSIIISPIFLFFKNYAALHGILIFNAFLTSSLIFPLYSIFSKFIKNKKLVFIYITAILLLPIVSAYERMILSETLFLTTNIWLLHFYIKSFQNPIHKLTSFALAILASLLRPFGFISIIALGANEIVKSKRKKLIALIFIITLAISFVLLSYFVPNLQDNLINKFSSLSEPRNYLLILKAIKNQANSLLISTLIIPLIFFITYIKKDRSKYIKNIRIFLITFILLNFAISAQHIYEYFLKGFELDLLTRYLNVSVVLIMTFGLIFFEKNKKFSISPLLFALIVLPLFFLTFSTVNHALVISLSPYYEMFNGFIEKDTFFKLVFLPTTLLLLILTVFHKRKTLRIALIIIIITQFTLSTIWQIKYTTEVEYNTATVQKFKDTNYNILFLESAKSYQQEKEKYNFNYWRLLTLTSNNVKISLFNDLKGQTPDTSKEDWKNLTKDQDYVISSFQLPLESVMMSKYLEKTYKLK